MATSQNGYGVIFQNGTALQSIPHIIGKVRAGDVAVIFTYIVNYFDANIENLDVGRDEWGWNVRPIRGQVSGYSNHASATAIDLNAMQHPRGRRGTFTTTQVSRIHAMLRFLDGVVRWGGDYPADLSLPDEMHFEINASAAAVRRVADKLRGGNLGVVEPVGGDVHPINTKADNERIQKLLKSHGYYDGVIDGVDGPMMKAAVKAFQHRHHLVEDGFWGPVTQAEWDRATRPKPKPSKPKPAKVVYTGLTKAETRAVQDYLADLKFYRGDKDGVYGPMTKAAVLAYQKHQHYFPNLKRDGEWGPATQAHMEWTKRLQAALNQWNGPNIAVDGDCGPGTIARVRSVQKANLTGAYRRAGGRVADGEPGPVTCKMLGIPKHPIA